MSQSVNVSLLLFTLNNMLVIYLILSFFLSFLLMSRLHTTALATTRNGAEVDLMPRSRDILTEQAGIFRLFPLSPTSLPSYPQFFFLFACFTFLFVSTSFFFPSLSDHCKLYFTFLRGTWFGARLRFAAYQARLIAPP